MTTSLPTPILFADFTTEGGASPNYIFNNLTYSSASSFLSAIGATYTNSTGKKVINSSGLLSSVAANALPFDYDPITLAAKGLLLEGASTNQLLSSQAIGDANWVVANATMTLNTTDFNDPTGSGNNATKIVTANGADNFVGQASGTGVNSTGQVWAFSFWARTSSGTITLPVLGDDGAGTRWVDPTTTTVSVTPTWTRFTVTGTQPSTTGTQVRAGFGGFSTWTTTQTVYLFGAQLEKASFSSSYISTTSATANRAADSLSASPISTWYNSATSVLYCAGDVANPSTNSPVLIDITDSNDNNDIALGPASSGVLGIVSSGGVTSFQALTSDSGQQPTQANVLRRYALSAAANRYIFVADAGTADIGGAAALPISPTQLVIGKNATGLPIYGHVQQIGYWPQTFSTTQLQGLTSGSFVFVPAVFGPNVDTTLTRTPAKAFTKKHYRDLLDDIREEMIAARLADEGLDDKGRADRDYETARAEFDEFDRNLGISNYAKAMDAKEKLDKARQTRDHHYYMEIVNKEWAKLKRG